MGRVRIETAIHALTGVITTRVFHYRDYRKRAIRTRNAFYNETGVEKANQSWSTRNCIATCVEKNYSKISNQEEGELGSPCVGYIVAVQRGPCGGCGLRVMRSCLGRKVHIRGVQRVQNVADEDVRELSNARLCIRRCVRRKWKSIRVGSPRDYATIWNVGLAFPESPKTVNEGMVE
jgi:hypothetical protein